MSRDSAPSAGADSESNGRPRRRIGDAVVTAAVVLIVLYSLLIVQQPLLGTIAALLILTLFYGLRFVRWFLRVYERRTSALESMAASLESMADDGDRGRRSEGGDDDAW